MGGRSAVVDAAGNVIVTGNATGEADFGNGQLTAGTGTIFVAKYSSTGSYVWAKRFGGTGWSLGTGIGVDAARNIYACGAFSGTVDFEGMQLGTLSAQTKDGYLIKISP